MYIRTEVVLSFRKNSEIGFAVSTSLQASHLRTILENGQCERYNATIWKMITLACRSRDLDVRFWEFVLPDALQSRMFNFARRSSNNSSIPLWLSNPGPVLLGCYVRQSKYDPLVDEVEFIKCDPKYAHIHYPDRHESNVSLRDLAPFGDSTKDSSEPSTATNNQPIDTIRQIDKHS